MRPWRFLLLVLLVCFNSKAFPAVFVVTNNADSGAGTLREALTKAAANGSAEKDYINFNLPGNTEANKTIILITQLPYVSSNLVIDGTTQPGAKLGRSSAKVILQPEGSGDAFNALTLLDIDGFELYGLYIRDFNGTIEYYDNQGFPNFTAALYIETSSNVQIGAPGKGNVFANDGFVETSSGTSLKDRVTPTVYSVKNFKFYANIVGYEPDGKTYRANSSGYLNGGGLQLDYCWGDIRIGDDDSATRNFFGNGTAIINQAGVNTIHESVILIKNNFFNYDIDGNPSAIIDINTSYISVISLAGYLPNDSFVYPYTVKIIANKSQFPYSMTCGHISGDFTMQGNKVLFEASVNYPSYAEAFGAVSDGNILIGGENPGEANILYGGEIDLLSRKSILLQHNSIFCVGDFRGIWYPLVPYLDPTLPLPVVEITTITATSISGTATPLSKVELFWDDDCFYCEPLTYVTTVNTNASGKWNYNGPVNGGVIASSTLNGFTSLFTKHPALDKATIQHASCGENNGSITSVHAMNSGGYEWRDQSGKVIASTADIKNLAPGQYILRGLNGTCSRDYTFDILDATPKINKQFLQLIQPSCNSLGSITGLYLENNDVSENDYNAYSVKWKDAGGNVIGTDIDLTDLAAGSYTLEVSYKNKCPVMFGPIILKNTTGPDIDQSITKVQSTNCGQSTGSITNIIVTGTGTLKYIWWNSQQQQVSTDKDLLNQPAGVYKLQVTDDTQCGPIYTTDITIPETNGIILDESKVIKTIASCGQNNGTVTGITADGATLYQWQDANGKIVSGTADLTSVPSGDYKLIVSNTFGCSKTSQVYHVDLQAVTQFPQYTASIIPSCYLRNNGSIIITIDGLVKSVRWVNSNGDPAGNLPALTEATTGTYKLYLTDQNGCEQPYNTYTVGELPEFKTADRGEILNDQCGLKTGRVSNVIITGGELPYIYKWTDANGNIIGTGNSIDNLAAGNYTLQVVDTRCSEVDIPYTITEESAEVAAPTVKDLQLCSSGNALIAVNEPSPTATYRLYETGSSTHPIAEQLGGRFNVIVSGDRSYFITQLNGTCESSRAEVKVAVGISTNDIANAFTPNADGVNDYWKISNIQSYPDALVQIFTRYGQKVFESRGYASPFDGTMKGKKLPAGVYYYIINMNTKCNLLSGSLTIIR